MPTILTIDKSPRNRPLNLIVIHDNPCVIQYHQQSCVDLDQNSTTIVYCWNDNWHEHNWMIRTCHVYYDELCNYCGCECWNPMDETLHWRHNDYDGVSSHQPDGCLLNRLFRRRSKKTSKLRVTGLCVGNSSGPVNSPHKGPVTRKMFPFDDVIMKMPKAIDVMFLFGIYVYNVKV